MTNPTTPQPVQEPAGAVEALKLVEKIKQHADECADQAWHAGECNERVGTPYFESLRLFNQALDQLAALASLPPVTQAKSEAVAEWQRRPNDMPKLPWERISEEWATHEAFEEDRGYWEVRALYAAPQEAVERQPLTEEQIDAAHEDATKAFSLSETGSVSSAGYMKTNTRESLKWRTHFARAIERHFGIGQATQEKQHG